MFELDVRIVQARPYLSYRTNRWREIMEADGDMDGAASSFTVRAASDWSVRTAREFSTIYDQPVQWEKRMAAKQRYSGR